MYKHWKTEQDVGPYSRGAHSVAREWDALEGEPWLCHCHPPCFLNSLRSGVISHLHPSWQKPTALSTQPKHTQDFTHCLTVDWLLPSALQKACGGLAEISNMRPQFTVPSPTHMLTWLGCSSCKRNVGAALAGDLPEVVAPSYNFFVGDVKKGKRSLGLIALRYTGEMYLRHLPVWCRTPPGGIRTVSLATSSRAEPLVMMQMTGLSTKLFPT